MLRALGQFARQSLGHKAEMVTDTRVLADSTVAGIGFTSAIWLQYVEPWLHFYMYVGGAILLALRILVAWRDYKHGSRRRKKK